MKLFFSEFKPNYEHYHFPYQVWLLVEEGDDVNKIYNSGFLPIRNLPQVYYLSRGVRVNLSQFDFSSENRRILNKTPQFDDKLISLTDFDYTPIIQKFCKNYMDNRFGKGYFTASAVKNIFQKGVYTHVFVWYKEQEKNPCGFAVVKICPDFLQYAHAFYDLKYLSLNLGARMILEAVSWAKAENKKYAYLGTVYDPKSFYKLEFTGVEFFNGFRWSSNIHELKDIVGKAGNDYFLKDKLLMTKYYNSDIISILNNFGVRVNL